MKIKIFLLATFLAFSSPAHAQTWTNVSPGWDAANTDTDSMAVYGANLYVGTFNGSGTGAQVWQYNGTTWTNVSPGWDAANIHALSMAVYEANLYVGTGNGGGAQVWQYDGATWTDVSPGWNPGNIYALCMAVYGGNLYVGTYNGGKAQVWQYNGTTWTNVSPGWDASNVWALSMAVYGANLYVGTYNGKGAQVWQYNGTIWSNVTNPLPWAAANVQALSMAVYGANLHVGTVNNVGGAAQVWQYNGTAWTNVSPGWDAANTNAESMAVYGANLYVGTVNVSGTGAQVWQYNGTTWTNVSPGWDAANEDALSMAVYGANLYVGTGNGGGAQVWQVWRLPGQVINISVSPASIDFGNMNVGSTSDRMITITNQAGSTATLTGSVGTLAAPFSVVSGGEAFNLNPGQSLAVTISFSPTTAGAISTSLSISHNATNQTGLITISLSGTGISTNVPAISVTPTSNDYGKVKVKKSKTASFKVTNNGKADLSVNSIAITGPDASMFVLVVPGGSKTIKPCKSLTVKVTFKPKSTGPKSANLEITSNDPVTPTLDITLSGTGQ